MSDVIKNNLKKNMQIVKEFKKFAVKGNALDLAVGVIIGGAFGKIISSLVNDIIMPPIGLIIGGINFSDLKIILSISSDNQQLASLNYGNFIQVSIEFLLISGSIFLVIKAINKFKKDDEQDTAYEQKNNKQEDLLKEIRDLLKK
jgi:large conductance mechanosensitive channel